MKSKRKNIIEVTNQMIGAYFDELSASSAVRRAGCRREPTEMAKKIYKKRDHIDPFFLKLDTSPTNWSLEPDSPAAN